MNQELVDNAKKFVKKNSHKILAGAAAVALVGAVYYYGKTKGETFVELRIKMPDDSVYKTVVNPQTVK